MMKTTAAVSGVPPGVRLEDLPCPLGCARQDAFVLEGQDRLHGIPGLFRIVRCTGCGLLRTNPRPTPESIAAYYPEDYGPYHKPSSGKRPPRPAWKRLLKAALGFKDRQVPDMIPGHLLEVGCASGDYLEEMRERGWQVQGIEFSDKAAEAGRAKGLPIQTASVETAASPQGGMDVVAAWMVLEHVHDPVRVLQRIRSWVKPGSFLIASVPDGSCAWTRVFQDVWYDLHLPNHLYHFTPHTLRKLLGFSGWTVDRIYWQKNPNILLQSLNRVAASRSWRCAGKLLRWLTHAPQAGKLRLLLGWILGLFHLSGRMEVWARPRTD
jgi:SAM-dependent methyltransferase